MILHTRILLVICYIATLIPCTAQKAILSESFQAKIDALGMEFYFPIEQKVKVKENVKDDLMEYDMILRSKNHFELRYVLDPISDQDASTLHPHIKLTTLVSTLATNYQEEYIHIQEISGADALHTFGAEWAVYADFVPKSSLIRYPYGRVISLFNSEKGMINCIILHREEELDGFLGMPIRFTQEGS